jgi:hypothetical protein
MWRIIEKKNDKLHTLFHGVKKSRVIPRNKWLTAENKVVNDGIGQSYISGFHCLETRKECRKYARQFKKKDGRFFVKIKTKGLRRKNSPHKVYLADKMLIPKNSKLYKI